MAEGSSSSTPTYFHSTPTEFHSTPTEFQSTPTYFQSAPTDFHSALAKEVAFYNGTMEVLAGNVLLVRGIMAVSHGFRP